MPGEWKLSLFTHLFPLHTMISGRLPRFAPLVSSILLATVPGVAPGGSIALNEQDYFAGEAVNVLVFNSWYNSNFSDSKISGIELIHHGERTATNGDVRLQPTPEQWDPIPEYGARRVLSGEDAIEADLSYPEYNFHYTIRAKGSEEGLQLTVRLPKPLPEALAGRAGFQLEFLPSAYFGKTYLMDERPGIFPLYPSSGMETLEGGEIEPRPLARGRTLVLAPDDAEHRVRLVATQGELQLFDGRHKAQNGWFVVRSLLPSGQHGAVVEWLLQPQQSPGWKRPPVIAYSQVGYHPAQRKVATFELDGAEGWPMRARLLRIRADGTEETVLDGRATDWGQYTRYHYKRYDFSNVTEPGLYRIAYGDQRSGAFPILPEVYTRAWHPTLDIFFPVQMDHMLVNEAYRVWHGAAHLDDARQAPVNHVHFDLYAQGPTTDTPYAPGEHIPGLNMGGWFDAGDYDIRTQTHYYVLHHLINTWERFRPSRDQTLIDRERRFVDLHHPDGVPDLLQQIEQGTLALIAQHRAVGHAIPGIIVPDISQYTHLGDALTMTDNLVHDPSLGLDQSDGFRSGLPDDRWAFTSRSSALNYGSIAALAAASRALKGYRDALAEECLETALRVWWEEQGKAPDLFRHGNTTGGRLEDERLKAAVELLLCTHDAIYATAVEELWPAIEEGFARNAPFAVRALPHMDPAFRDRLEARTREWKTELEALEEENPFGVPISTGGWAGSGLVVAVAIANEHLHRAFPDIIEPEDVYVGLHYIFGRHPDHNLSLVSGVGVQSKRVAYGMNRADFSFIAGGVVPGVLILPPDFPENKEDWPFLWGENEYVVSVGSSFLYLAHAAQALLDKSP